MPAALRAALPSYTRGHKAGGFSFDRSRIVDPALGAADPGSRADSDTSFAPEIADSYELGAKSSWLGKGLLFDGAVF